MNDPATQPAFPGHWQPIETAPKDGTKILAFGMSIEGFPSCWSEDHPKVHDQLIIHWAEAWYDDYQPAENGLFTKVKKQGFAHWSPNPIQFSPTHWQPLPPPPAPEGSEAR